MVRGVAVDAGFVPVLQPPAFRKAPNSIRIRRERLHDANRRPDDQSDDAEAFPIDWSAFKRPLIRE